MGPKNHDKSVWHHSMYDSVFAKAEIDSPQFRNRARTDATFLKQALNLKPGDRILDVPCGAGRHAAVFSRMGFDVVGVDLGEKILRRAQFNDSKGSIRFFQHDMIDLPSTLGKFDAVLNLFTSFGYFETDLQNERVLRQFHRVLKKNGRLAIHLFTRDLYREFYTPRKVYRKSNQCISEIRVLTDGGRYVEAHKTALNLGNGKEQFYFHRVRLYSHAELLRMLRKMGFKVHKVYDGFSTRTFRLNRTTHPVYIAIKR